MKETIALLLGFFPVFTFASFSDTKLRCGGGTTGHTADLDIIYDKSADLFKFEYKYENILQGFSGTSRGVATENDILGTKTVHCATATGAPTGEVYICLDTSGALDSAKVNTFDTEECEVVP